MHMCNCSYKAVESYCAGLDLCSLQTVYAAPSRHPIFWEKSNSTCICIFSLRQCTNSPLPVGVCLRKKEKGREGGRKKERKKFISAAKRTKVAIRDNRCEGRQTRGCSGRGQGNKWLDTAGYVLKVESTRSFLCENGVWEQGKSCRWPKRVVSGSCGKGLGAGEPQLGFGRIQFEVSFNIHPNGNNEKTVGCKSLEFMRNGRQKITLLSQL